jgi:hypothetical protein
MWSQEITVKNDGGVVGQCSVIRVQAETDRFICEWTFLRVTRLQALDWVGAMKNQESSP